MPWRQFEYSAYTATFSDQLVDNDSAESDPYNTPANSTGLAFLDSRCICITDVEHTAPRCSIVDAEYSVSR